jgi:hypothetical protein
MAAVKTLRIAVVSPFDVRSEGQAVNEVVVELNNRIEAKFGIKECARDHCCRRSLRSET